LKSKFHNLETSTHIWGISPEAIFIYLSDSLLDTTNIDNYTKLESIETNISKKRLEYEKVMEWFAEYLGFQKDKKITAWGKIVLINEDPIQLIQTCLMVRHYKIRNLFVDITHNKIEKMTLSEIETYFPGESETNIKLLKSFHFLTAKGRYIHFNLKHIMEIGTVKNFQRETENWLCGKSFIEAIVGKEDQKLASNLTSNLLTKLEIPFRESELKLDIIDAVKHIGTEAKSVTKTILLNNIKLVETLELAIRDYSYKNDQIMKHLISKNRNRLENLEIDNQLIHSIANRYDIEQTTLKELIYNLLFLQKTFSKIYIQYITASFKIELDVLTKVLAQIFGKGIRVNESCITFLTQYNLENESPHVLQNYLTFVFQTFAKNEQRIELLEKVRDYFLKTKPIQKTAIELKVKEIINQRLNAIILKRFSPFYFVYTLPLPENLGNEAIEKFKGTSDELERELFKLEKVWPKIRTETSYTFTEMADRLFSKGLECPLKTKEIKIMTPYTDYEIGKYVAMLRRLIERGYTIQIICRLHTKSRPWKIFRDGLLKGLGKKSKAVKVRTYTRFKEYKPSSTLKKLKENERNEFGIHAKLFLIGDADDGALLLGSANMLKNSYHWNPETGIYTENPNFIESAMRFFDFVWELAEKDSLDLSALEKIPKGPFFPSSYKH
jgi:hypothetical protein